MVWLVLCPTVMKKSLNALAISCGSVRVLLSYCISAGDDLAWLLDGMMDLRIFACSLGSDCASRSLLVRSSFFALVTVFLRLFLYSLCFLIFSGVGCVIFLLYSSC